MIGLDPNVKKLFGPTIDFIVNAANAVLACSNAMIAPTESQHEMRVRAVQYTPLGTHGRLKYSAVAINCYLEGLISVNLKS
jgi:hypothetical protein